MMLPACPKVFFGLVGVGAQSTASFEYLPGRFTTSTTLSASVTYIMNQQTFVGDGITLTIEPGTTIYAMPVGLVPLAVPALIVEQGGTLMASGTATSPITFTALNPEYVSGTSLETDTSTIATQTVLETRGKWGGIIILGRAPTSAADYTTNFIEGISGAPYGGTDPSDNSGVLKYVRVWHGGAAIAPDNEINGITFGGARSRARKREKPASESAGRGALI